MFRFGLHCVHTDNLSTDYVLQFEGKQFEGYELESIILLDKKF